MSTRVQIPMKPAVTKWPLPRVPFGTLQRKCACGGSGNSAGECAECKKKEILQRHTSTGAGRPTVPPIVHDVLRSPGQPLDAATRAFFEPRFGHDFSRVRVHTDRNAAESAVSINALAYTLGQHVVFAAGQYLPDASAGRELMAHELTHVLQQQKQDGAYDTLLLGETGDRHEQEADCIASSVMGMGPSLPAGTTTISPTASRMLQACCNPGGVVQRKVPTGIVLKETHPLGHANLKNEEDKKKYLTYIADVSLMQLTPPGDYTQEQQRGECTKEFLTEVSNTCPAAPKPFCTGDRCFQVNQYKRPVGDAPTGTMVPDGPDTFVDYHRAIFDKSLLEGSGKNQCSVVCHQLYKYRTEPDSKYHDLGAFYIIRNFKAAKFTPTGSTAPINITTGEIRKVTAGSSAPTKEEFAKSIAPGLVRSGALLDAPAAPPASIQGEGNK